MAKRLADYDYKTKMMINRLVLTELKRESGLPSENDVAIAISDSEIHEAVQQLADLIHSKAEELKSASAA